MSRSPRFTTTVGTSVFATFGALRRAAATTPPTVQSTTRTATHEIVRHFLQAGDRTDLVHASRELAIRNRIQPNRDWLLGGQSSALGFIHSSCDAQRADIR